MRCSPLVLVLFPALAGCATVRSEYTPASGEKLSVYDKAIDRTGVQRNRAGEDEIRDSTGRVVATNTRYTDKEVHWTEHDWYGVQGGVRIDDESFFRIAGDDKATTAYKTYHEDGSSTSTIGGVVVGIGLGLVGAGQCDGDLAAGPGDRLSTNERGVGPQRRREAGDEARLDHRGEAGLEPDRHDLQGARALDDAGLDPADQAITEEDREHIVPVLPLRLAGKRRSIRP